MSRLPRLPQRGRSGPWIVALGIALVLAIQPAWRDSVAVAVAGAIGLTLLASTRWQLRWLPVLVLIGCGVAVRLANYGNLVSDVSATTTAAINVMLAGGDPYGLGYAVSDPPGAAFPYGPVALFWYLPVFWDPPLMEMAVSGVLLAWFGLRAANGRPIGLAVFALAPPLIFAATDGSNDTSAGLMILAALAVAATRPAFGAGILAVAVAFKPYAFAWAPALLLWAGLPAIGAFIAASLVAWSPVLLGWGPGGYLRSLEMARETHLRMSYWSVASILDSIAPGLAPRALESARYVLGGLVAIGGALRVRTLDGVIIVGSAAFVVAQFAGYFGSFVYLAAVAPVLCWRVDDWVRMGLPELARAYDAMPHVGRRVRRPASARVSIPAALARVMPRGGSQRTPRPQPAPRAAASLAPEAALAGEPGYTRTRGRRPSRSLG